MTAGQLVAAVVGALFWTGLARLLWNEWRWQQDTEAMAEFDRAREALRTPPVTPMR